MYEHFYNNISEFIFVEDTPLPSDVIFVPGNGYPHMAEAAAKLWEDGYGTWVLPSGRYSVLKGCFEGPKKNAGRYRGPYGTEWQFLVDVLLKNGVPAEKILKEDEAMFTYENAILSRAALQKLGISVKRGIVCCRSIHARRCKMYYELVFPETEILIYPVAAEGIRKDNWYLSENGIEAVLGEMKRCSSQFEEIIKEMQGV